MSDHKTVIELVKVKKNQKATRMLSLCEFIQGEVPENGLIVRMITPFATFVHYLRDSDIKNAYESEAGKKVIALSYNDGKDQR